MEGLRKGSLFSFLEQAGERGAPCAPAFPRIRRTACRAGRSPGPCLCLHAASGLQGGVSVPGAGLQPDRPPCRFCLLPDGRWAICPCAPDAASCRKASYSAQRPARSAPATGTQADPSGGGSVSPHGGRSGVCAPSHTGQDVPGRTGRYGPGALEKADFQVESKKALPFAPAWDMDFRLCAGSGGMGPLTPHETNLRSYRC